MVKKQKIHVKVEKYTGEVENGIPVKYVEEFTFRGLVITQNLTNPELSLPLISKEIIKIHVPKNIYVDVGSLVQIDNGDTVFRVKVSSTKKPSPLGFNSFILCEGVNDE